MAVIRFVVPRPVLLLRLSARIGAGRAGALAVALLRDSPAGSPAADAARVTPSPTTVDDLVGDLLTLALVVLVDPEMILRADLTCPGSATTVTAAAAADRAVWLRSGADTDRVEVRVTGAAALVAGLADELGLAGVSRPATDAPPAGNVRSRSVLVQVAARRGGSTVVAGDVVAWWESRAGAWLVEASTGRLRPAGEPDLRQAVAGALASVLGARGSLP